MLQLPEGIKPLHGDYQEQHLISMLQLNQEDIAHFFEQASNAQAYVDNPELRGVTVLPHAELKAVMKQPSTRTGGSMATAMHKLGGNAQVISGMESSSEGKGESSFDSWIAFATQSDIIGTRTVEEYASAEAARHIDNAWTAGGLEKHVPIINLGDGKNEHPTQAIGDLFTIYQKFGHFSDRTIAIVGDQERYRAHHSLLIGARIVGLNVIVVESDVALLPQKYVDHLGKYLVGRTRDIDQAMAEADILYMGRNPDEYSGEDYYEKIRSNQLKDDYKQWRIDRDRIQKMKENGIVLHPRPRNGEVDEDVDLDIRSYDVQQMRKMIPTRMGIIATLLGATIEPPLRKTGLHARTSGA